MLANVFLNGLRIHVNLGAVYGLNKVLKGRGGSIRLETMKATPVMGESSIVLTFKGITCPVSKKLVQKRTRIKTINPQNNKTVTSVSEQSRTSRSAMF